MDEVDAVRAARLARDIDSFSDPEVDKLQGGETMDEIQQKHVSLRQRLKDFDARVDERLDHAVNVAAAKAVAAKKRIARELIAFVKAEDEEPK